MSSTNTITFEAITANTRGADPQVIARQIGTMNLMAISGGRAAAIANADQEYCGLILPVSNGYRVVVTLAADDTYTVRRVLKRGQKWFDKGTMTGVYCDQVSEVAYQASCFRNVDFG